MTTPAEERLQKVLVIKLVQERPCLWQKSHAEFKNKIAKERAWREVDQLSETNSWRKFSVLRAQYTRWKNGERREFEFRDLMDFMRNEITLRSRVRRKRRRRIISAPVAYINLPQDAQDFCKTIFDLMKGMPSDMQRELKTKILNTVTEEANKYQEIQGLINDIVTTWSRRTE